MARIHEKMKRQMFWNGFIRLFNEEYMTITLACMIKAYTLDFSNYYEAFLSAIALLGMVLSIVFPLIVTKFLWRLHAMDPDIMRVDTFKFKWGELTQELQVKDRMSLIFTLYFMFRRLFIVFIIVGMPRISWFQVQVIINLNTASILY